MENQLWAKELDEALDVYEKEQEKKEKNVEEENKNDEDERFKVEDPRSANWCFRKMKALEEKEKEIEKIAKEEINRIKEWKKEETEKLERSYNFFEGLLYEYFLEKREEDPEFNFSSPYGRISTREQRPKWNYLNEEETIEYLKEANKKEFVRVKESLDKREFKKNFKIAGNKVIDKETGAVVPGIEIQEREDKVVIKLK